MIQLREAVPTDETFLFALFAENKAREFASLRISAAQLTGLLQMQYQARCFGYERDFPAAEQYIVTDPTGRPVGQVLLHEEDAVLRLVDLAIAVGQRDRGFGQATLEAVQQRATAGGKQIQLQVTPGSGAERLYERLGFRAIATTAVTCVMIWSAASQMEVGKACAV